MKTVVCVKQVIDVSFPFEIDPEKCRILPQDVFYILNPADRCACEMAIRTREKLGGEVIAVSLGPARVRLAPRSCLAMGANRAIHVWNPEVKTDSFTTAYLLAETIRPIRPDMILCGSRSADEMSGEVPAALAEFLDLPQGTGVLSIDIPSGRHEVVVQRRLERGRRETILCPLPALIAVEPGIVATRYPSFPDLLDAHQAQIEDINSHDLGIDPVLLRGIAGQRELVGWSLPRPRPKKSFSIDSGLNADQRMELLMSGVVRRGKSDFLEGRPEDLASKLAEILTKRPWERK